MMTDLMKEEKVEIDSKVEEQMRKNAVEKDTMEETIETGTGVKKEATAEIGQGMTGIVHTDMKK